MSTRTCDRSALVEAMVDGRLGPSGLASTERHLKGCPECTELLRDLTSLRQSLCLSSRTISPLEHQRARLALLRRAAAPPGTALRPVGLLAAAVVTLPLVVWAASSLAPRRSVPALPPPAASPAPGAPGPSAKARTPSTDAPDAASAAAQAAPGSAASVGIIHTGAAPTTTTHAPAVAAPGERGPRPLLVASPPPMIAPRASGATQVSTHGAPPAPGRGEASEMPAPAAPSASGAPGASREFSEAMEALARGDFGASASQLEGFAAAHPGDPRAEEAAYLEAIALERAGRMPEARAAARRYLTSYPAGAHRAQARRLAGD